MKAWSFYFDPKVVEFMGVKHDAGNVIMGQQVRSASADQAAGFFRREEGKQAMERLKFCIEEKGKDLTLSLTKNKLFD